MEYIENIRSVNFWDGAFTGIGYLREQYLKRIDSYLGNQLIKVFAGQRRTGKSYLLRQVMQRLVLHHNVPPQNILYFNKETLVPVGMKALEI